jgi:hypothetical protein
MGADAKIKAQPDGEPVQTPALAARRNRHPGIADLIDTENQLRSDIVGRLGRQQAKEMSAEEYRESMRGLLAGKESMEG